MVSKTASHQLDVTALKNAEASALLFAKAFDESVVVGVASSDEVGETPRL